MKHKKLCVFVPLWQIHLNNKTRWSTKRKKASFEELGNFLRIKKRISSRKYYFFESKNSNTRRNKSAYRKITDEAVVKIVVLMRDFLT